jgi:hypothetical protein
MSSFDFKRLKRTMIIYRVVQTLLVVLLIFMAFNFQQLFSMLGKPQQFISGIIAAVVIQLILLYPVYRLAWRDSGVEFDSSVVGLTPENLAALRKKRLMGDLWKVAGIAFFFTFVAVVPDAKKATGAPLVLATTAFSFILACLSYFQCFNYSAKKRMKGV